MRSVLWLAIGGLFVVGCTSESDPAKPVDGAADESEIAQLCLQATGQEDCDLCTVWNWYDDGVCDWFCTYSDPDCELVGTWFIEWAPPGYYQSLSVTFRTDMTLRQVRRSVLDGNVSDHPNCIETDTRSGRYEIASSAGEMSWTLGDTEQSTYTDCANPSDNETVSGARDTAPVAFSYSFSDSETLLLTQEDGEPEAFSRR